MKPSEKKARENQRSLASTVELSCPFCGQLGAVAIDEGGGEHQTFVEDCSECCKPRVVHFVFNGASIPIQFRTQPIRLLS